MAHPKHEFVRERYGRRCGYCGIAEVDCGGEPTVDHYRPAVADGDESDDNLVYACFRCNSYKGDFWQTPDAELRVLHSLHDNTSLHFRYDETTGRLEPLTKTGRFHITLLRLNRPELVAHRLRQQIVEATAEQLRLLTTRVEQLERALAAARAYIAMMEEATQEETTEDMGNL